MFYKTQIIGLLFFCLVGCQAVNAVVEPYTYLNFHVADDSNPDAKGRPSPVVVKVYELSSRTVFDSQDFFTLYDEPESVLGPDLLVKDEFEFEPGAVSEFKMKINPNVRYAGVLVAYRDIENAKWREVIEIDTTAYDDLDVYIEELAVYQR
ncbi:MULTISPECIES: type VI secretion system lipoprotein TssJ [Corallincola]|uniref:Type VI secretion system lipoprotein TssJ n=3 Tax=Corallincola TaxID=1775176 RepID=A0A368NU50_9GAMM|nr:MULTISPECIES: type VI secretion system lipoprotein TssJ [Corallincola]RCU52741.1 type VI secretion system lipoprotein TssJ [Corallincola holothuriorum]TAA48731.1 type VI secretion system lipoprotein TssJ [Corallincola spongiicola]TCI03241.1 type VI secretion system lipoprotein TssJ [Corallincola luteus]